MPIDMTRPEYVAGQYADGQRLAARHRLHAEYSVADEPFLRWLFDREAPRPDEQLLEIGCGRGDVWLANAERFPTEARMVLTDASPGMAADAAHRLRSLPVAVAVADATALPFADRSFDVLVANHMLYHVADLARALGQARRALRPGGRLHASSNGAEHMRELFDAAGLERPRLSFTLESGPGLLSTHFEEVRVERHLSSLSITDVAPAVDYVASFADLVPAARRDLAQRIGDVIAAHGAFEVRKSVGLVTAARPRGV